MKKKIELILLIIFTIIIPVAIFAELLSTALCLYVWLDDEQASVYFNIACLLSTIEVSAIIITLIYSLIDDIKQSRKKKKCNDAKNS